MLFTSIYFEGGFDEKNIEFYFYTDIFVNSISL
jgi:hypothetical protein